MGHRFLPPTWPRPLQPVQPKKRRPASCDAEPDPGGGRLDIRRRTYIVHPPIPGVPPQIDLQYKSRPILDNAKQGFGTFKGVYVPNVLMMLGVILYLRLGYVTAQVGIMRMSMILGLSLFIMVVTGLSITSIVTNMRVGGGGAYYIISRALGIELGAALGILMYLSQIISIAMCTGGFALSFHEIYPQYSVQCVGVVALSILTLLTFVSADLTLKTQTLILVVLAASLVSVFTGSAANLRPALEGGHDASFGFWRGFAMFFPAVTGIEAGMAMSGTLKNPSRALPIGTLGALATCGIIYTSLAFFLAHNIPASILINNPLALQDFASVGHLVTLGIWGATLSSALGGVLGAPRMLQALAEDRVLPKVLGRTYGKTAEPRLALIVSSLAGLVLLLTTEMDQIIPVLTMVCLISYGILNFVAGFADLIHHPSWRPTFKTPWYVSFAGAAACFMVMLMIDTAATFVALALVVVLYAWVARKSPKVHFKDLRETLFFYLSRSSLYRLSNRLQHAKNWHLNLVAFVPSPRAHLDFVYFVAGLTRRSGILTFMSFLPASWVHSYRLEASGRTLRDFFAKERIRCFVEVETTNNMHDSTARFVESYGIGPLQPNTIALRCPDHDDDVQGLVGVMRAAATRRKNILLFRGESENADAGGAFAPGNDKRGKQIAIWWGGTHRNNFSLMLYLARVLMTTKAWSNAALVIKTVVRDTNAGVNMEKYLADFSLSHRLNAASEVLVVPEGGDPVAALVASSQQSDLVLMGLKPITAEDPADSPYGGYYATMVQKTRVLRNVAWVGATEEVTFKDVFID